MVELEEGYERKKEIKDDSKVFCLRKSENRVLLTKREKNVGETGFS